MSTPTQEIRTGGVDFTVTMLLPYSADVFSVSWSAGILVMRLEHDANEFLIATPLEGHGKALMKLPPATVDVLVGAAAGIRGRVTPCV